MKWSDFFSSSVGKKIVMSLTGLFLISFLIIHVCINACIFNDLFYPEDDGDMFNRAAHFMATSMVVRTLEYGLFIGFIIHIIQGYVLEAKNLSRRGKGYKINLANKGSKWYSRTMGLLGTLLLLFLIMHISHFWVPSRITGLEEVEGKNYHNLFILMVDVFHNPVIVVLYVLGCISLAYHLLHGFQSAFRTLGMHNTRYIGMIKGIGTAFSIIVPFVFALMPISIYMDWIGRN
ncbi:MAG: succinate dehydrogenase cytochrome b subunit [Chitinophagaceae bacterium]|nr:succinate dehydrogenase cytochrome b subunit [Chitinophagaceae bacterium]